MQFDRDFCPPSARTIIDLSRSSSCGVQALEDPFLLALRLQPDLNELADGFGAGTNHCSMRLHAAIHRIRALFALGKKSPSRAVVIHGGDLPSGKHDIDSAKAAAADGRSAKAAIARVSHSHAVAGIVPQTSVAPSAALLAGGPMQARTCSFGIPTI
jgi:hypothetical protein